MRSREITAESCRTASSASCSMAACSCRNDRKPMTVASRMTGKNAAIINRSMGRRSCKLASQARTIRLDLEEGVQSVCLRQMAPHPAGEVTHGVLQIELGLIAEITLCTPQVGAAVAVRK